MYDFQCERCDGTIRERRVKREAIRHKGSIVILEDVPIGVCDRCGSRYYHGSVLRRATELVCGSTPTRKIQIPIERYVRKH